MTEGYKIIYPLPASLEPDEVEEAIKGLPTSWNAVLLNLIQIHARSGLHEHAQELSNFFYVFLDIFGLENVPEGSGRLTRTQRAYATLDADPTLIPLLDHVLSRIHPLELPMGSYEEMVNELNVWRWICQESNYDKTCPHCGETKPPTAFHKNRTTRDGLASWCTDCRAFRKQTPETKARIATADKKYKDRIRKRYACESCDNLISRGKRCVDCRAEIEANQEKRRAERNALQAQNLKEREERKKLEEARNKKFEAPEGQKVCRKCFHAKPLEDFYINNGTLDGKTSWCRGCVNADSVIRARERRAKK